jgi:probable rRNA maturation factor
MPQAVDRHSHVIRRSKYQHRWLHATIRTHAVMSKPVIAARSIHVAANGVRTPVSLVRLEAAADAALKAERIKRAELSITLVSSRQMATLNRQHLGHRGPTDVITFALAAEPGGVLRGDIYICPDVAREQARTHGVGVREELLRLVMHGVLHACGHDHPVDATRTVSPMWRRQELLLQRFLDRPPSQ